METRKINLMPEGINYAQSDRTVKDGQMHEVINMRNTKGKWEPVLAKKILDTFMLAPVEIAWHSVTADGHYILYMETITNYVAYYYISGTQTLVTLASGEVFKCFGFLDNFLIVYTDKDRYIFLYDNNTSLYRKLEEVPMPKMEFYELRSVLYEIPETSTSLDGAQGLLEKMLDEARISGQGEGHTLFRCAWQMFDGSYLWPGPLHYLCLGNNQVVSNGTRHRHLLHASSGGSEYYKFFNICYGLPEFLYRIESAEATILEKYKGLIKSLAIFMTIPISKYENNKGSNLSGTYYYATLSEAGRKLPEQTNFYKIAEFSLEWLLQYQTPSHFIQLNPGNINNLHFNELMPDDGFSNHHTMASDAMNYNSLLHLGNVITKLCPGLHPFVWSYNVNWYGEYAYGFPKVAITGSPNYTYYAEIELETDQGKRYVQKTFTPQIVTTGGKEYLAIPPFYLYPDTRAKFMRLIAKDGANYYLLKTVEMQPNPAMNFAWGTTYIFDATEGQWLTSLIEDVAAPNTSLHTVNDMITDNNRVQASALNNPMFLPASRSYQVGANSNTVIAMTVISQQLSEGQFGQHPVVIFTNNGTWVLQKGSTDDVIYSNCLPLNDLVLRDRKAFCIFENSIMMATATGLYILSGQQYNKVSLVLEGDGYINPLAEISSFGEIVTNEYLVDLNTAFTGIDLVTYLENTVMCYDKANRELIISNTELDGATPKYGYSLIFNTQTNTWYKRTDTFQHFINKYTRFNGISLNNVVNLEDEGNTGVTDNYCLMQTRPLKLGDGGAKKIDQVILRCYMSLEDEQKAGVFIFGSNDLTEYVLVNFMVPGRTTINDIILNRTAYTCKYFIIVILGKFKEGTAIDFLEIGLQHKFASKRVR